MTSGPSLTVLSVTSECVPFVKTGGLADVAGALPAAVAPQGVAMRTLLPGYPAVLEALGKAEQKPVQVARWDSLFGGAARLFAAQLEGRDMLVLDAPHLFTRDGTLYLGPDGQDWPDNDRRFAALSWVAAQIGAHGIQGWKPCVLHLHDWQAGLTPAYLHAMGASGSCGTLMTIHNIAFQGLTPASQMHALQLPEELFSAEGFEYWGQISALKAGLVFSDRISTVSPTYARELLTPEFGTGLDGVLRARAGDVCGILNGIDKQAWAPPFKSQRGKASRVAALRKEAGLPDSAGPLCVVISRLSAQKGLDVLLSALPALLARGGQLVLLGSGDPDLEDGFRAAAQDHAGVSVRIGYNEPLSRRMMAGAEAVLVPSRFEPCGLTQLYGLHHGAVPVVARTGGLADTVIDANAAALRAGVATGIHFAPVTAEALAHAFHRLCDLYDAGAPFRAMQRAGMKADVGWESSAEEYARLYAEIAKP